MGVDIEQYRRVIGLGGFAPMNRTLRRVHSYCFRSGNEARKAVLFIASLLMLISGDIELNPGPGPNNRPRSYYSDTSRPKVQPHYRQTTMFEQHFQNSASNFNFAEPHQTQPGMEGRNHPSVSTNQDTGSNAILEEIRKMNAKFDNFRAEVSDWRQQIDGRMTTVEQKVDNIFVKLDDLENRSRRNNLLFFGVDDKENESWEESEEKVRNLIQNDLGFSEEETGKIEFQRAHRIGHIVGKRPIVAMFQSYKDRSKIFFKARDVFKTDGSARYVKQDFSERVKDIRQKLSPFYMKALNEKCRAKVAVDKLIVNGIPYRYDYAANNIVRIPKQNSGRG